MYEYDRVPYHHTMFRWYDCKIDIRIGTNDTCCIVSSRPNGYSGSGGGVGGNGDGQQWLDIDGGVWLAW